MAALIERAQQTDPRLHCDDFAMPLQFWRHVKGPRKSAAVRASAGSARAGYEVYRPNRPRFVLGCGDTIGPHRVQIRLAVAGTMIALTRARFRAEHRAR